MKKIFTLIFICLLIFGLFLAYNITHKFGILSSLSSIFGGGYGTIDDTPVLVEEIKNISELLTQSYYDEIYLDSGIIKTGIFKRNKRLTVIAEGTVKAGFDLSGLTKSNFQTTDGSLILTLPPPKILSVVSNPSNREIFISKGAVSQMEINTISRIINEILTENAIRNRILEKSIINGKKTIQRLLEILGYEDITIQIEDPVSLKKGNDTIAQLLKDKYRDYSEIKSVIIDSEINLYRSNDQIQKFKVQKNHIFPNLSNIKLHSSGGFALFEIKTNGKQYSRRKYNARSIPDETLLDEDGFITIYRLLKRNDLFTYHHIRVLELGGQFFDVLYALSDKNKWIKIYINRKLGLIKFIETYSKYKESKVDKKLVFSDFKKIGNNYIATKTESFVRGVKISETNIKSINFNREIDNSIFIIN